MQVLSMGLLHLQLPLLKDWLAPFRNRAVREVCVRKGSVRTCRQLMNGRGRRSERRSSRSDSNKVHIIVCSLAVNKGDG